MITLSFACNIVACLAPHVYSLVGRDASDWSVSKSIITKCLAIRYLVVIALKVKFISLYLSGIAVSGLMLLLKEKELADNPEFKASLGWYQNWKRCHSVSM